MKEELFVNKYQPLYFKDFEGKDEIISILKVFILMDSLNVLIIGDMAYGKTTILNAIIREYYMGYNSKEYENNILYINNLKEQGINYYRTDVKTFCQTHSIIRGKKKLIILDDIDFINEQSQQIFRNYIDKFSNNVNIIASCSNNRKVIDSLQSRLTIVKLNPFKKKGLIKIMKHIQIQEGITMDEDAEDFIITICNYNIKNLINYMEKFKLFRQHITFELANQMCTNISFLIFEKYTNCVLSEQLHNAIQIIYGLYENGYSVMDILDNYFLFIKITHLLNDEQKYKIIPYLCKYITIFHNIHEDEIELALFTNNIMKVLALK
jgi:DNA polymerase III delta prime subunit